MPINDYSEKEIRKKIISKIEKRAGQSKKNSKTKVMIAEISASMIIVKYKMKIKKARKVMRKAFKDDPDFKRGYVDNVSMCMYDRFVDDQAIVDYPQIDIRDKEERNKLAKEIIDLIFGK